MAEKTGVIRKKPMTKAEMEKTLIDNFTNLQKVLTNLSIKFEDLSNNMSKMLQLFEISAKSFAEKHTSKEAEKQIENKTQEQKKADKEYLKKLDSLLDQNKTIAQGIMLMEKRIRHRNPQEQEQPAHHPEHESRFQGTFKSKPLPRY
jgi:hypothetical protein